MTDIILILYGDRKDLDICLESVEKYCTDYNTIIIDNNKENKGFTKACNEAISSGSGEYIWLLNQDAILLPGAQQALIKRLETHSKVGIAGSMQLSPDDQNNIRFGGASRAFPSGIHKGGYISMGHCLIPEKQTWVNGASLMIKRDVFDKVGPMDESMFLLYSESDLCYMTRKAGYEVWYEPESRVIHKLGKASNDSKEIAQKDMMAFMKKWGITMTAPGKFSYSREFAALDKFP